MSDEIVFTKSEIAFLDAAIELMVEQRGATATVTIPVNSSAPAQFMLKATRQILDCDKTLVYKQILTGGIGTLSELADMLSLSPDQRHMYDKLRSALADGIGLEDLIELRERIRSVAHG